MSMTLAKCAELCLGLGYNLMGYEYQKECFCENTSEPQPYLKHGLADTCYGGKGGDQGMDVYLLETSPDSPTKRGDYIGCYGDSKGDRIFDVLLDSNSRPVDECAAACSGRGYDLSGLQFQSECWCGYSTSDYRRHGQSSGCTNGRGGTVAMDIYVIADVKAPGNEDYVRNNVGCWQDDSDRFFEYLHSTRKLSIDECDAVCRARGSTFMAMQYQVECFCSGEGESYKAQGRSNGCAANGKGGSYAAQVYQIAATEEEPNDQYAYQHVGCYADTKDNRFFKMLLMTDTTVAECAEGCGMEGAAYFSMQFPDRLECWCGSVDGSCDDYDMHGRSGSCENGLGGVYAGDVYQLSAVTDPCIPISAAPTTSMAPVTPPVYGRYHLGCWTNKKGNRVFSSRQADKMSLDQCEDTCRDMNSVYFGFEYQIECFCSSAGESYGQYGESTACTNGMGGSYSMDVYEINYVPPVLTGETFIGCYRDVKHTRALSYFYRRFTESHLSNVEACRSYCATNGYKYMGMEDLAKECFCGSISDDYTQHGAYNGCRTLDGQSVGGYYAISVYDLATEQTAYPTMNVITPAVPAALPTEPPAVAPVNPLTVTTAYMDCVTDVKHDRIFENVWSTKLTGTADQKVLQCANHCRNDLGSEIFGIQFDYECFCGAGLNDVNIHRHGKSDRCEDGVGGNLAMSVYSVANAVTPETPDPQLGITYRGCWSDNKNVRLFDYQFPGTFPTNGASLQQCALICALEGFAFMGYQDQKECWCGRQDEDFMQHGKIDYNCEQDADGYHVGGFYVMAVYEVSATSIVDPMAHELAGCFKDHRNNRICPEQKAENLSLNQCWSACTSEGFAGMGYQYQKECWCCTSDELVSILAGNQVSEKCTNGLGGSYSADVYVPQSVIQG